MDIPAPFHVLIIEDSPDDRADIRQMLLRGSPRHYKFTEAETGSAALRALREAAKPPDCILLDFNLPDMNALDLLAEWQAATPSPGCPVVVLTGVAECGPRVIGAGAQDFVGKSWASPESLTRAIENAVERYALGRERLLNDAALRESRHFLQRITGVAPGVLHVYDLEKQSFVYVSEAVASVIGYRAEEITAMGRDGLSALIHPEDLPRFAGHLQRVRTLGGDEQADFEHRVRTKSGEWRWFQNRVSVFVRDTKGAVLQAIGAALDITERKLVAEANRLATARFELALKGSAIVVFYQDLELRYTWIYNPALGFEALQVIGKRDSDIMERVEDVAVTEAIKREVIRSGVGRRQEVLVRAQGVNRYYDLQVEPLREADGRITGVQCAAVDITERRQAEEAVKLNAALFAKIIEQAPGGVFVMDAQLRVREVNTEALPVFASVQPVIGRELGEVLETLWGPELGRETTAHFRRTLETGERYVSPRFASSRHDIGVEQAYEWQTQRLTLPDGQHGVVCYFQDVTARERAAAALRTEVTERKQAEGLQHASSAYARSLIEASLDPLVTISAQGKITDVNEASVQATGVPREQLIGTDFSDYFTAPDHARAGYRQVFSEGLVRDYPLAIRHTSGRVMDVLYNAAVYRDDKGNVLGVFAAARDVTVQKQASQYARSLIEASLDPLVTISAQGKITDVNEASVQATGVPREQLIGTDFSDYFTAPDNARAGYRQVFSEGLVRDYPLAIRHTTGRIMDVLYNAVVYRDDQGKVLGAFAAARDVTVQKQASQYARSLIEASLDPLVTISAQGKITDVNEASVQATGVPREQLIGTDFSDYFTAPDHARAGYRQVFSEGLVRDYPLAIRHTTGRIMDVLYNAAVYRDDKGKVLGVFAAARDVTERKRFEQSLERTNEELRTKSKEKAEIERKNAEVELARVTLEEKAAALLRASGYKSEFLANMSHELRTPLNVILLLSQQLAQNKPGNLSAKQREFAHLVHSSGTDLLNLINDILDLAKIESGTVTVKVEEVSLARLCDSLTRHFQPVADAKKLTLRASLAGDLPPGLQSDTQRVRQILKNLVANSLKFTARGRVEVRVGLATQGWPPDHPVLGQAPQVIAFAVEDTGIGIAPEQQQRIFESFQQADATTSRHHGGTGLGLAISRDLAGLLGGAITLTSAPGRGSTFTLYLPQKFVGPERTGEARDRKIIVEVLPRPEPSADHPDVARSRSVSPFPTESREERTRTDVPGEILRGRKVLVVDDDVRNIFALTALLETHEMDILSATDGRSAIRLLQTNPDVGLVLMDIMMPDMDGYEIMRQLRQSPQFRTLPILALTAHAMPGDREKCLAAGASDYLTKPVNSQELIAVMTDWMER